MQHATIGPRIDLVTDRRRSLALPLVLAAHAVLWWLLHQALLAPPPAARGTAEAAATARLVVRLLPLADEAIAPRPTIAPQPSPPAPIARGSAVPPRVETLPAQARSPGRTRLTAPAPEAPLTAAPEATTGPAEPVAPTATASASASASAPTPAASASADTTPLLDTAATRRAIRESARQLGSAAQMAVEDSADLRAPTTEARLPGAIERSGKGDCAKGGYVGGGMGLLSLPFLAAAVIKGDCAK